MFIYSIVFTFHLCCLVCFLIRSWRRNSLRALWANAWSRRTSSSRLRWIKEETLWTRVRRWAWGSSSATATASIPRLVESGHCRVCDDLQERTDGRAHDEAESMCRRLGLRRRQQRQAEGYPKAAWGGLSRDLRAFQKKWHKVWLNLDFSFGTLQIFSNLFGLNSSMERVLLRIILFLLDMTLCALYQFRLFTVFGIETLPTVPCSFCFFPV